MEELCGGPIDANDNTWELGHELFLSPMDPFSVYEHWTHHCNCTDYTHVNRLSWVEPSDDGEGYYRLEKNLGYCAPALDGSVTPPRKIETVCEYARPPNIYWLRGAKTRT